MFFLKNRTQILGDTQGEFLHSLFESFTTTYFHRQRKCVFTIRNRNTVTWLVRETKGQREKLDKDNFCCLYDGKTISDCKNHPCGHTLCWYCTYKLIEFVKRNCSESRTPIQYIEYFS